MILTAEQRLQLDNGMNLYVEGINHIGQPFNINVHAYAGTDLYSTNDQDSLAAIFNLPKNKLNGEAQQLYMQIDLAYHQDVSHIPTPTVDNARLIALRIVDADTNKVFWEMSGKDKRRTLANAYLMRSNLVKYLATTNEIIVTEQDMVSDDVTFASIKNLGAPITYETAKHPTLISPYVDTIAPIYMTRDLNTGCVNMYGYGYMSILEAGVQRLASMQINSSSRCCAAHKSVKYFTSANNNRMPSWRKEMVYKQSNKDEISPPSADFVDEREGK